MHVKTHSTCPENHPDKKTAKEETGGKESAVVLLLPGSEPIGAVFRAAMTYDRSYCVRGSVGWVRSARSTSKWPLQRAHCHWLHG